MLCEAMTQPFEVMPAKKFPGMLDPTPLSQAFAKQGLRIPTVSRVVRLRDLREDVQLTWTSADLSGKGRIGSDAKQTRTRWERDCKEAQKQDRYRFRQVVWARGATEQTVRQPRCRRRISTRKIRKTLRLRETHTGRFRPDLRSLSTVTAIARPSAFMRSSNVCQSSDDGGSVGGQTAGKDMQPGTPERQPIPSHELHKQRYQQ